MKVKIKRFALIEKFSVNVSTWSNQEVAKFLNNIINPSNLDKAIYKLTPDQLNKIKDTLGNEPKLPASFREIYNQFKSSKLNSIQSMDNKELLGYLNKVLNYRILMIRLNHLVTHN